MATARTLAELGADETCIAAALLKDILLRSMMTEQQLRGLVPSNIADLVVKVGRLGDICQVPISPHFLWIVNVANLLLGGR